MEIRSKYKTSRISFFSNYLFASFLLVFLALVFLLNFSESSKSIALLVCVPLVLVALLEPEIVRIYRYYLLEEDNITMVEGIFSKKKISIPYDQIAGTTIKKSLLGRILKFGDVKVSGFKDEILLKGIKNPDKVYEYFQKMIRSSKKKK